MSKIIAIVDGNPYTHIRLNRADAHTPQKYWAFTLAHVEDDRELIEQSDVEFRLLKTSDRKLILLNQPKAEFKNEY